MATPVVTVAAGGIAVVDVTATTGIGVPVHEASNGRGIAVTQVIGKPGMPVVYRPIAGPFLAESDGDQAI